MALIKCKECATEISENVDSCPRCGIIGAGRKSRVSLDSLNVVSGTPTIVFGTIVIPAAGAALAWFTFVYYKNSQEYEKLRALAID